EICQTLAAALARRGDPDRPAPEAIVLDLALPDSDGAETFERLLSVDPPPVVVLSSRSERALALSLLERGAPDYLVKGEHSAAAIARAVHQAIERSRLEEERRVREEAESSLRAQ